jgi:hypothetical protein
MTKRKVSVIDKLDIVRIVETKSKTTEDIAMQYGICVASVYNIKSQKGELEKDDQDQLIKKRIRIVKNEEILNCLMCGCWSDANNLSQSVVRCYARKLLNDQELKPNNGWLQRF